MQANWTYSPLDMVTNWLPRGPLKKTVRFVLARFVLIVETCADCGDRVDQVWTAENGLWAELAGDTILCIRCFDWRATRRRVILRWVPRVDWREE